MRDDGRQNHYEGTFTSGNLECTCPCSHPLQILDSNLTHSLTHFQLSWRLVNDWLYRLWRKQKCRPFKATRPHSKPIPAKEERNIPPSANKWLYTAEPKHGHAVFHPLDEPTQFPLSHSLSSQKIPRDDNLLHSSSYIQKSTKGTPIMHPF